MHEWHYENIRLKLPESVCFYLNFFILPLIHCAKIDNFSHIIGMYN